MNDQRFFNMLNEEKWLEHSIDAIMEMITLCEIFGAIGSAIPLFTEDLSQATDRVNILRSVFVDMSQFCLTFDKIELDTNDNIPQYRVKVLKKV